MPVEGWGLSAEPGTPGSPHFPATSQPHPLRDLVAPWLCLAVWLSGILFSFLIAFPGFSSNVPALPCPGTVTWKEAPLHPERHRCTHRNTRNLYEELMIHL